MVRVVFLTNNQTKLYSIHKGITWLFMQIYNGSGMMKQYLIDVERPKTRPITKIPNM